MTTTFITVQISPARWVVAQDISTDGKGYRVCTRPLKTASEANKVREEFSTLDSRDYSPLTRAVDLDI